jgi:hypothetical protein
LVSTDFSLLNNGGELHIISLRKEKLRKAGWLEKTFLPHPTHTTYAPLQKENENPTVINLSY